MEFWRFLFIEILFTKKLEQLAIVSTMKLNKVYTFKMKLVLYLFS